MEYALSFLICSSLSASYRIHAQIMYVMYTGLS